MKKKLQELGYGKETMLRLDRMFFVYLRMCISQEKSKCSKNTPSKAIHVIRKICEDDTVDNIIKNYPVQCLGVKQRIFLMLRKLELCMLYQKLESCDYEWKKQIISVAEVLWN